MKYLTSVLVLIVAQMGFSTENDDALGIWELKFSNISIVANGYNTADDVALKIEIVARCENTYVFEDGYTYTFVWHSGRMDFSENEDMDSFARTSDSFVRLFMYEDNWYQLELLFAASEYEYYQVNTQIEGSDAGFVGIAHGQSYDYSGKEMRKSAIGGVVQVQKIADPAQTLTEEEIHSACGYDSAKG